MKSDRHLPATAVRMEQSRGGGRHEFVVTEHPGALSRERLVAPGARWQTVHRTRRPPQRTLVVGADETGQRLAAELIKHFPADFDVVALVAAPSDASEAAPNPPLCDKPILEGYEELRDLARRHSVDRIMFANCMDNGLNGTGLQVRSRQDRRGPHRKGRERRREVADFQETATSAAFKEPETARGKLYNAGKRSFDILFSLVALTFFAPILAVLWPFLKLTSPGPVFYAQERVGLDGKPFTIYKLRTMRLDAESKSGPVLSPYGDTRSTPLGRLLRITKLDECPQFWNVLKGEMAIVGPRPERPHFTEPFSDHIFSYSLRHSVRPGLTGLAQIRGDHLTHVYIKLHYDLIYVTHRSPLMDVAILAQTPYVILRNVFSRQS